MKANKKNILLWITAFQLIFPAIPGLHTTLAASGISETDKYVWNENAGRINFGPANGGVTIASDTGQFDGYAWGENMGWIHFKNASPEYYVQCDPLLVNENLAVTVEI